MRALLVVLLLSGCSTFAGLKSDVGDILTKVKCALQPDEPECKEPAK